MERLARYRLRRPSGVDHDRVRQGKVPEYRPTAIEIVRRLEMIRFVATLADALQAYLWLDVEQEEQVRARREGVASIDTSTQTGGALVGDIE